MSDLFTPLSLQHGPAMKNRFMLAPLTNTQSHPDGTLSDDEFAWLTYRAEGGFGLTMTCAAHVQAIGQGFPGQLGVFGDQHLPGLTRLAAAIKAKGSIAALQLHHAGNRSPQELIGQAPVCPSDDPETGARALTLAEVEQLRDDFIAAAVRSEKAGFDGVEIHGAHGYVLCQFLSPTLNRREDRYGGSLENRARLLLRVVDAVREAAPSAALTVRFSASDWADGGWDAAQTAAVAQWAAERGAVLFDISSGGLVAHQRITTGPGYQVPLAAEVRRSGGLPVSAVGEITSGTQAEAVLQSGDADVILAGREWLRDPHFALRAATELGETDASLWPPQYVRAMPR